MGIFWAIAGLTLVAQFVFLVLYSGHLYQRFDVSADFAHNAQAWFLIGHGNVSPTDTIRIPVTPFWRDHFDLIIWVLSPLRWISEQPLILLWVQDAAVVATEAIALLWIAGICVEDLPKRRNLAATIGLIALVVNSWWYQTVSFDIHMPPLGTPFLLLAAYSFWKGRFRTALISSLVCLLFGAVVAELVLVVGVAALCSRRVRSSGGIKWAVLVAVIGVAWFESINLLGANQASNLATNYGYLADPGSHVSIVSILRGAVTHPSRVTTMLQRRWRALLYELVPTGFLGLLTPWGLFFFLGLLVPSALASSPVYSSPNSGAFQNLPAMPFILVGSFMIFAKALKRVYEQRAVSGRHARPRAWRPNFRRVGIALVPATALVLGLAGTAAAVSQSAIMAKRIPSNWLRVSGAQAAGLRHVIAEIPSDSHNVEVIASYGIIGRFSNHKYVYDLAGAPQGFFVDAKTVYFVITPYAGYEPFSAGDALGDVRYVRNDLHAETLYSHNGVWLLEWHPGAKVKSALLPG